MIFQCLSTMPVLEIGKMCLEGLLFQDTLKSPSYVKSRFETEKPQVKCVISPVTLKGTPPFTLLSGADHMEGPLSKQTKQKAQLH